MTVLEGSTLTTAALVALVEGASVHVDAGLELLDADDVLIADISDDFLHTGSRIERGIFKTVHGTARLRVSRELLWGSQRLRPFLKLSADGVTWYRWNLGVYRMATPERVVDESVPVWDVECFDKLDVLNTLHPTYSLPAGSNVVAAVTELIEDAGETAISIEASDAVTSAVRVFSVLDGWTTLGICNELLDMIGYRGLWVDLRDARYRSVGYVSPADLPTVWTYNADSATTTVGEQRTSTADLYRAANVVIGVNDLVVTDTAPIAGAGVFQLANDADGPTSIDGRGGTVIRREVRGEYTSQSALETAVRAALDAESRVASYVEIDVSPTPVHGHFDVVKFSDNAIPVNGGRFLVTDFVLPLDGANMSLSLRGV